MFWCYSRDSLLTWRQGHNILFLNPQLTCCQRSQWNSPTMIDITEIFVFLSFMFSSKILIFIEFFVCFFLVLFFGVFWGGLLGFLGGVFSFCDFQEFYNFSFKLKLNLVILLEFGHLFSLQNPREFFQSHFAEYILCKYQLHGRFPSIKEIELFNHLFLLVVWNHTALSKIFTLRRNVFDK